VLTVANILHPGSDETVTITGLYAGGYLNSATVTYALVTEDGTAVSGGTGSFSYVAASNGNYTASIESTVTTLLTPGTTAYLNVTISESGYNDFRRIRCPVAYRANT
jgi:hypothetical protein